MSKNVPELQFTSLTFVGPLQQYSDTFPLERWYQLWTGGRKTLKIYRVYLDTYHYELDSDETSIEFLVGWKDLTPVTLRLSLYRITWQLRHIS